MPSALETAIAQYRAALTARDAAAQARLIGHYQTTRKRLLADVKALGQISEIRADPGRLAQHDRAIALLGQVETELRGLGVQTVQEAVHTQRILTRAATAEAARLAGLQSPGVAGAFNALSPPAVESLVGSLSDGSPLAESAGAIFGQMNTQVQSELLSGLALGEGPIALQRRIGALADKAMATRVMPMVRSAMLGAHRQASLETYRLNDDVVSGYKRVAAKQGNTCLACLALDGDIYPLDRMLPTHPNCRCALIPIVKGHKLPFETGAEWFAAQPEAFQRRRLGPEAFERYKAGTLNLRNFVEEVDDPRWGLTVRERSQRAALGGNPAPVPTLRARPRPRPAPAPPPAPPPPAPLTAEDLFTETLDEAVAAGQLRETQAKLFTAEVASGKIDPEAMRDLSARLAFDVDPRRAVERRLELAVREGIIDAAEAASVRGALSAYTPGELREHLAELGRRSRLQRLSRFPDLAAFDKTYDEAKFAKAAQADYDKWRAQSTKEQGVALDRYKNGDFTTINRHLRKGKAAGTETKDQIRHIDEAMEAARLSTDAKLMRGTTWSAGTPPDEWKNAKPGDILTDKGYVSATFDAHVAKGFGGALYQRPAHTSLFDFYAPKGTKALFIDPRLKGSLKESEILLARNTRFLVREVKRLPDGAYDFVLEVIP